MSGFSLIIHKCAPAAHRHASFGCDFASPPPGCTSQGKSAMTTEFRYLLGFLTTEHDSRRFLRILSYLQNEMRQFFPGRHKTYWWHFARRWCRRERVSVISFSLSYLFSRLSWLVCHFLLQGQGFVLPQKISAISSLRVRASQ